MYTSLEISKITHAKLFGKGKQKVEHLLTDSRSYFLPENSLFFAFSGTNHNGHDYIPELYKKGVETFVVETLPKNHTTYKADFLLVRSAINALQKLAAFHKQQHTPKTIAITGSNGKTIVKEWLYEFVNSKYISLKSPRSYNSQIGVPLSVWNIRKEHEWAIFEAGISKPDEMHKLAQIIKPDIGIFTNIGDAHQENFQSVEQKMDEKLKLFQFASKIIYCKDHKIIHNKILDFKKNKNIELFAWSRQEEAFAQLKQIQICENKPSILQIYCMQKLETFEVPFSDNASIENFMHIYVVLKLLNIDNQLFKSISKQLHPVPMRLDFQEGINNCTLLNDAYNSDETSFKIALDFFHKNHKQSNKTLILSDFHSSISNPNILYQNIIKLINKSEINKLILIGEHLKTLENKFSTKNVTAYTSTEEFITNFELLTFKDEAILLKGARKYAFENIERLLRKKSHTTVLEISLDAMVENLNFFRKLLKPKTKIMVMVKAFSYGSGSVEIAQLLEHQGVNYLGVAFTDEGVSLRKAGIKAPILVLNPDEESYYEIIKYGLEPEIYSFSRLSAFARMAEKYASNTYPIHIKIDTGMHRLGFDPKKDIPQLLNVLKKHNHLRVQSIFSHLVASEDPESDDFTKKQILQFKTTSAEIQAGLSYPITRHLLNSSGIERHADAQFEMVRLGIGLYGIASENQDQLKHISRLSTRISQIKTLSEQDSVGYNRMGRLTKTSRIATLPIGYADGLPRSLSNRKGHVLVNNKLCEIIGNICMDMCMIDVTETDAKEGDKVIIFGPEYPVTEIARQANTIPYEIFTGISQRVKRQYIME